MGNGEMALLVYGEMGNGEVGNGESGKRRNGKRRIGTPPSELHISVINILIRTVPSQCVNAQARILGTSLFWSFFEGVGAKNRQLYTQNLQSVTYLWCASTQEELVIPSVASDSLRSRSGGRGLAKYKTAHGCQEQITTLIGNYTDTFPFLQVLIVVADVSGYSSPNAP